MRLRSSLLPKTILSTFVAAGLVLAAPLHAGDARDLAERAQAAYAAKDYAQSATLFADAAHADPDNTTLLYNGACANALAGRTDIAFDLLRRAVDAGWSNGAHMAKDTDLASLHGDPRWQKLLAGVDAASAQRELLYNSPALASAWNVPLT